jgi:hypothetical protein
MNKYGGVDNQKTIDEIQEAEIVAAPIFHKIQPKSRAAVIGGWLVYWFISWLIIFPLLVATGLTEQLQRSNTPWWLGSLVIPSVPFMLTLIWSIFRLKKGKEQKDAGD